MNTTFPAVLLLAVALPACAGSGRSAAPGRPAAVGVQPCVYGHGTALTHLPDGRTLAEAWEAARAGPLPDPGPGALAMLPLAPGASEPELENVHEVGALIARHYPAPLRDAGIAGTSTLLVWVGADGRVAGVRVVRPAADPRFDEAAERVVRSMRFRPSRAGACAVASFLVLPVSFMLA